MTLFFAVLGLVWMVIIVCLLVDVHASVFRVFDSEISQGTVSQWRLAASCLAVDLWGLVAVVLLTSGVRVLPLLVGAHVARAKEWGMSAFATVIALAIDMVLNRISFKFECPEIIFYDTYQPTAY